MSYGDIAKFAIVPAELPKVEASELKKRSDYRIIGKSVARLDTPAKVNGKSRYGMDVQVPNMVYATLLRAPIEGAAPDQIDDSAVKQIPGIIRTITLKDAVALVGNSVEGVFAGRNALKVVWKGGATAGYNSEAGAIEGKAAEWLREDRGTALAAWRAIGSGFNKFAIEAFIDDIALELKTDPVALRLRLLRDHPRGQKVLQTVADMAGWGKPVQNGRALGVAYADIWSTPTAGIAEISVDRGTGKIRVHNFWNAVNPGIVVNPKIVESQSESNVIYGLSQALKERITLVDGAVAQSNFSDYEVLRMSEAPEIHTRVIVTDDKPTGIGEIVLPLVAPAVSNAVLALTGKRLRHLPMTPDRVKAALA
jgi:CO/xanthine dehydrogenase Mo-binding subunit